MSILHFNIRQPLLKENHEMKKLILFHFCPNYTDEVINNIEKNAQGAFKSTIAAKQGLKIQF